jgi:signal transduction histidine kinase
MEGASRVGVPGPGREGPTMMWTGSPDVRRLSVTRKLRWLIFSAPCLVLSVTALVVSRAAYFEIEEQARIKAQMETRVLAGRVGDLFDRVSVLARALVRHQEDRGRAPDPGTMATLVDLLRAVPEHEAQGLCIAFENKHYLERDAVQRVDRRHWARVPPGQTDFHSHEWYAGARSLGRDEEYFTAPYLDEIRNKAWIVSVTRPVFDREGDFVGVAGVEVAMDSLRKVVSEHMSRDWPGAYAYLVSSGDQVFALPESVKRSLNQGTQEGVPLRVLREGLLVAGAASGSLVRVLGPRGERRLVSWYTFHGRRWKVVLSVPEAEVYAPASRMIAWSAGLGILGLVLMIGIVSAIASRVVGPIGQLSAVAASVEAGDYRLDGLAPITGRRDEVGTLARTVQRMVEEVAARESDLDARVRLRTHELEVMLWELRAAKEATEQAMKQQEIFLSNIAHDLRTPLTIVIGFSEDLLRRARKQNQAAFVPDLRLIVSRGRDLLELINDLLSLSRSMNDRRIELELEEFDIAAMISSQMEGIGSIAAKNGNTIEFRPAPGLGPIIADRTKVWRILLNLLSNSCKFTRDGFVTLDVDRIGEGDDARVVFRVSDTGMGMTTEQQHRLFVRFSQVHSDSAKMQSGVGLGLSICLLYCQAMGGTITVESVEGKGSTFTVALPVDVRDFVGTHRRDGRDGEPQPLAEMMGRWTEEASANDTNSDRPFISPPAESP